MSSQSAGRRRSNNVRQYSVEDQALNMISKEAESRLAAKRAARAEAREIRMKEMEKQHKNTEDKQDRIYELTNDHAAAKIRQQIGGSRGGSRRGSTESTDSGADGKDIDFKAEVRELEDKYKAAMMTSAQLDNEKQSLVYQVELLKDQLEEQDEGFTELQREYKDKCREYELQKRDMKNMEHELNILKQQLELKDRLIQESGFVIMSNDKGEPVLEKQSSSLSATASDNPLPSGDVLVSPETKEFLEKAGDGTLGTPIPSNPTTNQSVVTRHDSQVGNDGKETVSSASPDKAFSENQIKQIDLTDSHSEIINEAMSDINKTKKIEASDLSDSIVMAGKGDLHDVDVCVPDHNKHIVVVDDCGDSGGEKTGHGSRKEVEADENVPDTKSVSSLNPGSFLSVGKRLSSNLESDEEGDEFYDAVSTPSLELSSSSKQNGSETNVSKEGSSVDGGMLPVFAFDDSCDSEKSTGGKAQVSATLSGVTTSESQTEDVVLDKSDSGIKEINVETEDEQDENTAEKDKEKKSEAMALEDSNVENKTEDCGEMGLDDFNAAGLDSKTEADKEIKSNDGIQELNTLNEGVAAGGEGVKAAGEIDNIAGDERKLDSPTESYVDADCEVLFDALRESDSDDQNGGCDFVEEDCEDRANPETDNKVLSGFDGENKMTSENDRNQVDKGNEILAHKLDASKEEGESNALDLDSICAKVEISDEGEQESNVDDGKENVCDSEANVLERSETVEKSDGMDVQDEIEEKHGMHDGDEMVGKTDGMDIQNEIEEKDGIHDGNEMVGKTDGMDVQDEIEEKEKDGIHDGNEMVGKTEDVQDEIEEKDGIHDGNEMVGKTEGMNVQDEIKEKDGIHDGNEMVRKTEDVQDDIEEKHGIHDGNEMVGKTEDVQDDIEEKDGIHDWNEMVGKTEGKDVQDEIEEKDGIHDGNEMVGKTEDVQDDIKEKDGMCNVKTVDFDGKDEIKEMLDGQTKMTEKEIESLSGLEDGGIECQEGRENVGEGGDGKIEIEGGRCTDVSVDEGKEESELEKLDIVQPKMMNDDENDDAVNKEVLSKDMNAENELEPIRQVKDEKEDCKDDGETVVVGKETVVEGDKTDLDWDQHVTKTDDECMTLQPQEDADEKGILGEFHIGDNHDEPKSPCQNIITPTVKTDDDISNLEGGHIFKEKKGYQRGSSFGGLSESSDAAILDDYDLDDILDGLDSDDGVEDKGIDNATVLKESLIGTDEEKDESSEPSSDVRGQKDGDDDTIKSDALAVADMQENMIYGACSALPADSKDTAESENGSESIELEGKEDVNHNTSAMKVVGKAESHSSLEPEDLEGALDKKMEKKGKKKSKKFKLFKKWTK